MQIFKGIIQRGLKRGSALGYPTVNIPLNDDALSGVYAARVETGGKEYVAAVFANQERNILEAYLLDFDGELYGEEIHIELYKKIRDSKQFEDDEALRAAIAKDIEDVRDFFKKNPAARTRPALSEESRRRFQSSFRSR